MSPMDMRHPHTNGDDLQSWQPPAFPRVELPGVEQATRDYIATSTAETLDRRRAFVLATLRLGKPIFEVQRNGKPSLGKAVLRRRAANRVAAATRRAQRRAA